LTKQTGTAGSGQIPLVRAICNSNWSPAEFRVLKLRVLVDGTDAAPRGKIAKGSDVNHGNARLDFIE